MRRPVCSFFLLASLFVGLAFGNTSNGYAQSEETTTEQSAIADEPRAFAPEAPLVPVRNREQNVDALRLLRRMLSRPANSNLPGASVSLGETLTGITDPTRHRATIGAYWNLVAAVARYYNALEQAAWADRIALDTTESPELQAFRSELSAAAIEAKLAAMEAQQALAQATGFAHNTPLLPSDSPVTTTYETHYERLFGEGAAPASSRSTARHLHAVLPVCHQLIATRAAAVRQAERTADEAAKQYTNSEAPLSHAVEAFARLATGRRALIAAVLQYNQKIGDYATLVAPQGLASLPMLIHTPQTGDRIRIPEQGVQQASGETALPADEQAGVVQAGSVQPVSPSPPAFTAPAEPRRLRSVLVPSSR